MIKLIIVGGGAAGLFAAVTAKKRGLDVTVLDHSTKFAKKILSTGNGKCNMTNLSIDSSCYYSRDNSFVDTILKKFTPGMLIDEFNRLGLGVNYRQNYVYPVNEQAASVRNILVECCYQLGVNMVSDCEIDSIIISDTPESQNIPFTIFSSKGIYNCHKLLICTGGKTLPSSGSDGTGYKLAKDLGHRIIPNFPALTAIKCKGIDFKKISGVRAKGKVSILKNNILVKCDSGEIQFTNYGVSGIPVFNLSRIITEDFGNIGDYRITIDLLKDKSKEDITEILKFAKKNFPRRRLRDQLTYMINDKLVEIILEKTGIDKDVRLADLDNEFIKLTHILKNLEIKPAGYMDYDFAQVTGGGIDTSEIDSATMMSKLVPGLYFAGEILDVDGICGGYNLHFAWATAFIAANSMEV